MPYTKDEAQIKIAKLVEDFRAHEATLEKVAEVQDVESAVDVSLIRAGRLMQSVLRSAFEGRL